MEKKQPLLTIRPHFSPLLAALESIAVTMAGTMALSLLGGTVIFAVLSTIGLGRFISGGAIYGSLFVLGLALLPPLYYEIKRRAYRGTTYSFYDDCVEFHCFRYFINRRIGRIMFRDITNVTEHANVVQQREKITSIYLFAPSVTAAQHGGFPGLKMADVAQTKDWTRQILRLIDQNQRPVAVQPLPSSSAAPAAG